MRAVAAGLFVVCVAARADAQPAAPAPEPAPEAPLPPAEPPPPEPDFAKATELYNAATKAMEEARHADAARDFLAAYEITKDPVLFFKIGSAYEKAGACDQALGYYERYLSEAKPAEHFVALTTERIEACKAQPAAPADPKLPQTPAEAPGSGFTQPSRDKDTAWLFVGGSLAFVTAGAVLAYSTASAEADLRDLYISQNGMAPEFDADTKERFESIEDEGRRYQYLSWASFGIAAGCAIGATIFFLRDKGDVTVTPVVTPKETGVAATLRF